ncbi:MAG: tRNA (guanosine(46)-N7)-methyltransferase TrmB [Bacteroidota bacterium]|nr:tRNA (guanosine(46)-N7)-methyltransferase TrmB [Bacteroidota bacterium]
MRKKIAEVLPARWSWISAPVAQQKLQRFKEFSSFSNTVEKDVSFKGKWRKDFFKNQFPICLELACGKGEYAIGLAEKYANQNFIGVDIKANRMWKGARYALENQLTNVGFLRTQIDHIEQYFESSEVDEIWITFPDPQHKKERKRLTNPIFLGYYNKILRPKAFIHLKTDDDLLYEYTLEIISKLQLPLHRNIKDLYKEPQISSELELKTFYEKQWIEENKKIKYLQFSLN